MSRSSRHRQYYQQSPEHRLGDEPIQAEYHQPMMAIAETLDEFFNGDRADSAGSDRKTGFVLMVFPFGDKPGGRCNYISNGADRKDIVALMKEMIARFEGQPEPKAGQA